MEELRQTQRKRTFRSGKVLFNQKGSILSCTVRNLSDGGACLQLENLVGVPERFELLLDGEAIARPCRRAWEFGDKMGVSFEQPPSSQVESVDSVDRSSPAMFSKQEDTNQQRGKTELVRAELLSLRAALDHVPFGVVLLDNELRAQFINRAFRQMWRMPDAKADSKPAFVALMYHGRDTRAYEMASRDLDAFVAKRVALVKAGDPTPIDLRLLDGQVLRFQCTVLPAGGRMLSYTYVTDIVRRSDELEVLRDALNNVKQGVVLLDADLNVEFMNRAVRGLWQVADEDPQNKLSFGRFVKNAYERGSYGLPPDEPFDTYLARRMQMIRKGDERPTDIPLSDGRVVRSSTTTLPNGRRMLTYNDVTDLVRNAQQLQQLATIDGLTGVFNRRHFLDLANAEWARFQRYHRPLTLLLIDIDHFKSVNDRFGHDMGDEALVHIAKLCEAQKRTPDVVARIGGEEFAVLLPETDADQASLVAERLRNRIAAEPFTYNGISINMTISIGVAGATLSMAAFGPLMKKADDALYKAKARGRNCIVQASSPMVALDLAAE